MKKSALLCCLLLGASALAATAGVAQCWAVTRSGSRCKRRAAIDARYCRQHSAARAPAKPPIRCRAMTTNGVQCAEAPSPGRSYCPRHLK